MTDERSQIQRADAVYPEAMQWFEWALPFYSQNAVRLDVKDRPSGCDGRTLKSKYPRGIRAQIPEELHEAWRAYMGLRPRAGTVLVSLYAFDRSKFQRGIDGNMSKSGQLHGDVPGLQASVSHDDGAPVAVQVRVSTCWGYRVYVPPEMCDGRPVTVAVTADHAEVTTTRAMVHPILERPSAARWLEPEKIASPNKCAPLGPTETLTAEQRLERSRGIWRRYTCSFKSSAVHGAPPRKFDREVAEERRADAWLTAQETFARWARTAGLASIGATLDAPEGHPDVWRQAVELVSMTTTCKCCGKVYEGCQAPGSEWSTLRFVGIQELDADAYGPAVRYELRDCMCTATLSVECEATAQVSTEDNTLANRAE